MENLSKIVNNRTHPRSFDCIEYRLNPQTTPDNSNRNRLSSTIKMIETEYESKELLLPAQLSRQYFLNIAQYDDRLNQNINHHSH